MAKPRNVHDSAVRAVLAAYEAVRQPPWGNPDEKMNSLFSALETLKETSVSSHEYKNMPIEFLDLSTRTYHCLKRNNINTIAELMEQDKYDLMDIRNFGERCLQEVRDKLAEWNIGLKGEYV